ncbi:hypothetical protein BDV98DRAFT_561930 [Pterulicium gracile]|uniref:Uncharacterized protein n=1 Tax=Pterulicium gracile TaxID=1884261 RepID=A0A5C3QTK4_9AGAR|nr:hypothetical protein BDV98DRAFT_561930 [Pterula gracilis]
MILFIPAWSPVRVGLVVLPLASLSVMRVTNFCTALRASVVSSAEIRATTGLCVFPEGVERCPLPSSLIAVESRPLV